MEGSVARPALATRDAGTGRGSEACRPTLQHSSLVRLISTTPGQCRKLPSSSHVATRQHAARTRHEIKHTQSCRDPRRRGLATDHAQPPLAKEGNSQTNCATRTRKSHLAAARPKGEVSAHVMCRESCTITRRGAHTAKKERRKKVSRMRQH